MGFSLVPWKPVIEPLQLVRRLSEQRGLGVVVVLHDTNMAGRFCDQIIALKRGRLLARGTPQEMIRSDMLADIYGIPRGTVAHPRAAVPGLQGTGRRPCAVLVPASDLFAKGRVGAFLEVCASRYRDPDLRGVASHWAQRYVLALLPAALVANLVLGRELPLEPERTSVVIDADAGFMSSGKDDTAPLVGGKRAQLCLHPALYVGMRKQWLGKTEPQALKIRSNLIFNAAG